MRHGQRAGGFGILAGTEMTRSVDESAAQHIAPRERIDPRDEVVGARAARLHPSHRLSQVSRALRGDLQLAGMHMFRGQNDARHDPEHPETADRAVEEVAFAFTRRRDEVAARQEQIDLLDVLADRAHGVLVLAVDVHRERTAQRRIHRAADDLGPESERDRALPQAFDRHAAFARGEATRAVEREDPIHARRVEHDAGARAIRVAVTVPAAARCQRDAFATRECEGFADGIDVPRTQHASGRAVRHAPALDVLVSASEPRELRCPPRAHTFIFLKTKDGMQRITVPTKNQRRGT